MSRRRTCARISAILRDGRWHNARNLARRLRLSTAGVTARLRDMRKTEFGGHIIAVRRPERPGVYDYRMESQGVRL